MTLARFSLEGQHKALSAKGKCEGIWGDIFPLLSSTVGAVGSSREAGESGRGSGLGVKDLGSSLGPSDHSLCLPSTNSLLQSSIRASPGQGPPLILLQPLQSRTPVDFEGPSDWLTPRFQSGRVECWLTPHPGLWLGASPWEARTITVI